MFSSEECAPDCNDKHVQDDPKTYGKSQRPYATFDANNNQLRFLGLILEEVYINPSYPPESTELAESLQSSGVSRADLWAFSSLVGLKYAEFLNNDACRRDDPGNGKGDLNDCHYHTRKGKISKYLSKTSLHKQFITRKLNEIHCWFQQLMLYFR